MLILQNNYKCHNINLVTPTHFVPNILEALYIAVQKGFNLPIVYNCGGYESIETLKLLDGIVDIYMPDFKYHTDERGIKYFRVRDYPKYVKNALKEMDRQVGGLKVDDMGVACRGLLIRHLVMPGGLEDTREILKFIKDRCIICDEKSGVNSSVEYLVPNQDRRVRLPYSAPKKILFEQEQDLLFFP